MFWDLSFIFHLIFDYNTGGVFNACADPFYQEIYHLIAGFQSTTAPDSTYPVLKLHGRTCKRGHMLAFIALDITFGEQGGPDFPLHSQPTRTLRLHGHRQRVYYQTPFHFPEELPHHTPTQELVLNGRPLPCSRPDFSKTYCYTAQSYICRSIPTRS